MSCWRRRRFSATRAARGATKARTMSSKKRRRATKVLSAYHDGRFLARRAGGIGPGAEAASPSGNRIGSPSVHGPEYLRPTAGAGLGRQTMIRFAYAVRQPPDEGRQEAAKLKTDRVEGCKVGGGPGGDAADTGPIAEAGDAGGAGGRVKQTVGVARRGAGVQLVL